VALFFRPDLTKVDLAVEREQLHRNGPAGAQAAPPTPTDARRRAG
jgi:hypothetical protein